MKYYTVYKITNLINRKIYIGKHETHDLDDGYFGSGKYLKRALLKYGKENFSKEILHVFDNEEEMNNKEAELVSEEFVSEDTNYNLCVGGKGGFGYINSVGINNKNNYISGTARKKLSKIAKEKISNNPSAWLEQSEKGRQKIQEIYGKGNGTFTNKFHSKESKRKIGKANAKIQAGKGNSQYGTTFIHNKKLRKTTRIKANSPLPEGWEWGGKFKWD